LLERGQDGYLSAVSATQARQNVDTTSMVAILRVLSAERKPMSARGTEDQHGGVRRTLKMSKERVREMVKLAIERGYLDGGDRKPLVINSLGADWMRCFPEPKADAAVGLKSAPRKKS
jgi:dihydroxyacetone kinase